MSDLDLERLKAIADAMREAEMVLARQQAIWDGRKADGPTSQELRAAIRAQSDFREAFGAMTAKTLIERVQQAEAEASQHFDDLAFTRGALAASVEREKTARIEGLREAKDLVYIDYSGRLGYAIDCSDIDARIRELKGGTR